MLVTYNLIINEFSDVECTIYVVCLQCFIFNVFNSNNVYKYIQTKNLTCFLLGILYSKFVVICLD